MPVTITLSTLTKPFVFKVTKVVDKLTGKPLAMNNFRATIEVGSDTPIEYTAENISEYRLEIPVGAEAYVLVKAPGYTDWELVLRPKADKYMEGPIEMLPLDSPETESGL